MMPYIVKTSKLGHIIKINLKKTQRERDREDSVEL